ncbi:MAG: nucleotidyltransferase domain-containing protein [Deltaproteobacteria bacterium]|nr:nucleotidyltransferase domain-containing protein [Deltaproteobacteria bacterium]
MSRTPAPGKTGQETLRDLVRRLRSGFGSDLFGVVLFGSRARGDAGDRSDFDVFVIADRLPSGALERHKAVLERIGGRKGPVNFLAKTKREFEEAFPSLYLDLAKDGIVLFDKTGYMKERLERIGKITREAGLSRVKRHRGFFWRWKRKPLPTWRIDWSGVHDVV